jgi:hypothetical protein
MAPAEKIKSRLFELSGSKIADNNKSLYVFHRGDSFIKIDITNSNKRFAANSWTSFGFTGIDDPKVCKSCEKMCESCNIF